MNFFKKYWWALLLVAALVYFVWKWNAEKSKKAEIKEVVKEVWRPTIGVNAVPKSTVDVAQTYVTPSETQSGAIGSTVVDTGAEALPCETVYGTAGQGLLICPEDIEEWGEDVLCSRNSITGRLTCDWA